MKRQVAENPAANCFSNARPKGENSPSSVPPCSSWFPMSTWWQVPCTRLSPEKAKKTLRDKARALAQGPTCKVSETKCLFETKHLHDRFSHQPVSTLARYQPWWCGSAECFSRALVWLQSVPLLVQGKPIVFGDLEKQWWKRSRLCLMLRGYVLLVLVQIFLVREVCCWFVFLQGKAGAVFSEVPHSVLLGACSMHTMAFSWPPPSPVLCALLGLHAFFDFLHLVLIESVLSLAFIVLAKSFLTSWGRHSKGPC